MSKRKFFSKVLILMVISICFFACSSKKDSTQDKKIVLTTFTFDDLKQELRNPEKEILIINFWATWCGECRKEMPEFIEFYDKYKDKVKLIGLALDKSENEVKKFIEISKINFPIYLASEKLAQHLMINAIPTTFFFKNGKFVKYHVGRLTFSDLKLIIENLSKSK